MFPREAEAIEVASGSMRGASDNLSATGVVPDLNQRGGGQGFSRGGDSDSESVGDVGVRGAGGGSVAGSVREGPGATDEGGDAPEVTGGGVGEFSSPVLPTRRSSGLSQPGSSAISAGWEPSRRAGSFPDDGVDVDGSVEYGEGGGVGDGAASGFAYDGGRSADAGDTASQVEAGGGGARVHPGQSDPAATVRGARGGGSVRFVRHRPPDAGPPPALLMMKDPQLPFAVMATRILSDLHVAGRPTRVAPRWRRF